MMHAAAVLAAATELCCRCVVLTVRAGEYPTFGDYCRTLDAIISTTGDTAEQGTTAYKLVGTWPHQSSRTHLWRSCVVQLTPPQPLTHQAHATGSTHLANGAVQSPGTIMWHSYQLAACSAHFIYLMCVLWWLCCRSCVCCRRGPPASNASPSRLWHSTASMGSCREAGQTSPGKCCQVTHGVLKGVGVRASSLVLDLRWLCLWHATSCGALLSCLQLCSCSAH
jgi:hypothetical protein